MRILLMTALSGVLAGGLIAGPSEHLNFGKQVNASQCNPAGGKLVINVVQHITNDIDSGMAGNYWAYDDTNRQIQVWQTGENQFCATVKYQGAFTTVAGASPNNTGSIDAGITGTFEGGYTAAVTGTLLASPAAPTKGNIGNVDYACDAATGPDSCTGSVSWLDLYFAPGYTFAQPWWGWIYHAGDNGSWVNAITGSTGDIHN